MYRIFFACSPNRSFVTRVRSPLFFCNIFRYITFFYLILFSVVRQVVWTGVTRKSPENAWVAKVPTWPLTLVFLGQLAALAGGVYHVVRKGESSQARAQEAFVGRGWGWFWSD